MDRITRYSDASCFFCPAISSSEMVPTSKQLLAEHGIRHPDVMRQNCRSKTKLGVTVTQNEIKKLGARKYFEDRGVYRNPYSTGSLEFNEFERGWMQSLKKDEGRLVSQTVCATERQSIGGGPTATEIAAERYRSRKG